MESVHFDDITFEQATDGTITGAFGRCIACDAYQWLGFSMRSGETQVWCPSCDRREPLVR